MKKHISISVQEGYCVLVGSTRDILSNKRCLLSFKRLEYSKQSDGTIRVPVQGSIKDTFEQITRILIKYEFKYSTEESIKKEIDVYEREIKEFKNYSEKARKIRNDNVSGDAELEEAFADFQSVLQQSMRGRVLHPRQLLSAYYATFAHNSCNFSVPGAGKTSIVYGAYAYLKQRGIVNKILVIGPLSSFKPWENEYHECFGMKCDSQRLSGDESISKNEQQSYLYFKHPKEITLMSYAKIKNLEDDLIHFLKNNKVMVVVDEAHRIKNPERVWGKSAVKISEWARARIVLTGTPTPNGYEDIYNLYRFIYPFRHQQILNIHYEQLKELTKKEKDNKAFSAEKERVRDFIDSIKPFFVRIRKRDLKLPPTREETILVDMSEQQREIYDFIEKKYIAEFRSNSSATAKDFLNKAKLMRLRQASTNPSLLLKPLKESLQFSDDGEEDPNMEAASLYDEGIDDSVVYHKVLDFEKTITPTKYETIRRLLEEKIFTQKNGKAIVWAIFIQNAYSLQGYLNEKKIKAKLLIGDILQDEREETIDKFNDPKNDEFKVIIANPFAVAESISLHMGCHNAIYMERDYNCATFLQSKDRIHRVGLQEDVQTNYFYILSKDSIDTVIDNKLQEKAKRMEKILDEDIPLFARIDDTDEKDVISALLEDYAKRTT